MGTPGGCPAGDHLTGRSLKLFTPKQYLTAYGVEGLHAQGISGQGQSVAVLSFAPGRQSDLATFTNCFGLATPHLQNIPVGVGTQPVLGSTQVHDEISLDTEMVTAMAPQLSDIDVIHTTNASATGLLDLFDAPLDRSLFDGPMPSVVTFSGGICEIGGNEPYSKFPLAYALYEHLFMDAAANGVSVVAASGDWGSSCNLFNATSGSGFGYRSLARQSVQFPASSPFVTGVGGALFGLNVNDSIKNEEAWNDLPLGVGLAGGGGESAIFTRPWYQDGLTLSGSGRLVPDVSLEADTSYPIATYCSSGCQFVGWQPGGGTSAAAPLLAGGIALANQAALSQQDAQLGLINPLIYQLGKTDSSALVDIAQGNNDVYGLDCCTAGPGYDEATGWGSVNFSQLIQAADATTTRS
jgi:kumamolisin